MKLQQPRTIARDLWTFALLAIVAFSAFADDAEDAAAKAARLKVATEHVRIFEVRRVARNGDAAKNQVELIDRPLLTYGDPARANENGTVWAWGKTGRPLAFLELFQAQDNHRRWVHAITLTSTELIDAKLQDGLRWTPKTIAIKPLSVPNSDTPAEKESLRLRQMKAIAGRFTAHEFWDPGNSRYELRLLVQPVHRYSDTARDILDGTIFVFAHGTNPEILLLVEALGSSSETAKWHFSAARLGSAELHLELDQQDVWTQPRTPGIIGTSNDPYWLFFTTAEAPPRGTKGSEAREVQK